MKKVLWLFPIIILLSSCSGIQLTNDHLTMVDKISQSEVACYQSLKPNYTGLPKEVISLLEAQRNANRVLLAVLGKDPCKQTNFYDATIAVAQSKNNALTSGLGTVGNISMAFLGADVFKTALQEAGDSYRASEWARIDADKDSGNIFYDDSGNTQYKDSGNTFAESPINSTSSQEAPTP